MIFSNGRKLCLLSRAETAGRRMLCVGIPGALKRIRSKIQILKADPECRNTFFFMCASPPRTERGCSQATIPQAVSASSRIWLREVHLARRRTWLLKAEPRAQFRVANSL